MSFGNVKVDRWILREYVVPSVFFDSADGPDTARIAAAVPEIDKCLAALDAAVAKTGFLVGVSLTYADMNVLPMLTSLLQMPEGNRLLERYVKLGAYIAKLSRRPAFPNAAPPPRS